jgi:hypothetical protein
MPRSERNIRMDLTEVIWKGVNWTHMAHDRNQWWDLVKKVVKLRIRSKAGNSLTPWITISFSRTLFHIISHLLSYVDS